MIREPEDIQNRVRNTLGPIQTLHDVVEQLIMHYGNDEKFAKDWNFDIPPEDLQLYERLIQERTEKENEQSHIDG